MSNKDLDLLINEIKMTTGDTQEMMASRLKYSRAHFSVMKQSSKNELIAMLELAYRKELSRTPTVESNETKTIDSLVKSIADLVESNRILALTNREQWLRLSKEISDSTSESESEKDTSSLPQPEHQPFLSGKRAVPGGSRSLDRQKGKILRKDT